MFTLWILFLMSTFLLYWIYDGYGRFLQLAALLSGRSPFIARSSSESSHPVEMMPSLTALLTVHNEEATIEATLQNLLSCDYPTDRFQILVASDGSTDRTNELIRGYPDPRVQLFESPGLGKTGTQNLAIQSVESDLLLFVDAGVRFEPGFLREIAAQFRDPAVGAVDGRLLYPSDGGTAEVAGQGFYWRYELKLRELESRLGLLAVMTGACMSIRRDLFVEMDPSIGEDCIVPLDIVCQHRRVVHASAARAVDHFEEGAGVTLRRRIRMTLRNWQGTWTRPALLNPFRHPGYAFALWSHKLLRWLSPVFLIVAAVSSTALLSLQPSVVTATAFLPYAALMMMAGFGWLANRTGKRIPLTGTAFTFLLANTAFLIGVLRAIRGQRIRSYRNA